MTLFIILLLIWFIIYILSQITKWTHPHHKKQKSSLWINSKTSSWIEVRSKAEKLIWECLDEMGIEWEYEKNLIINGKKVSNPDFYLPKYDIYIEYFWLMSNPSYKENAIFKMNSFRTNNIKVVDLYPEDITEKTPTWKSFYSKELFKRNFKLFLKRANEKRKDILHTKIK